MNIPEYYEDVSIRLKEVLDASGLGEDLRWWRINTWLQMEELHQLLSRIGSNTNDKLCYFGSQAEATSTHGIFSDIDKVSVISYVTVLEDLQFWELNPHTQQTFLMVTDDITPPGYVKLQLVLRDAPILVNNYQNETIGHDRKRRSVLKNNIMDVKLLRDHVYQHGPASSFHYIGVTADMVMALHAHCWPVQSSHWLLSRFRRYNWPSRRMIDVIQQTGVLLVPVGHKLSSEQQLEWRLSFSFGEKLLMMNMNSTQYKCYVMLKFIKKAFINVNAGEDVITSYHCKTCMFYLMESTPNSLWIPTNLLFCIDLCLRLLLSWVECQNCPNYFIPEENMFLGKNLGPVKKDIASILHELLRQSGRYVTRISFEHIGENVVRACQSLSIELVDPNTKTLQTTFAHLWNSLNYVSFLAATRDTIDINVSLLSHGLRQEVVSIVQSLYCSGLGIHLTSKSLEQDIPNQENLTMAHELLLRGTTSDVASGKLKLAEFYLVQNDLKTMEALLNHVDSMLTPNVYGVSLTCLNEITCTKIVNERVSLKQVVRNYIALEVYFGASDIHGLPKAFIMETFRSTVSEPGVDILLENFTPVLSLRADLYLYILQYQCYHLQRRIVLALVALGNMIRISQVQLQILDIWLALSTLVPLRHDINQEQLSLLAQVTTTLNLLAYCLMQSVRPMSAFKILCKSMKMKNHHNAAMWQIATCIISIVRTKDPQGN
ncbi:hypothetical protein ACJMK2_011958 [Sinanodonta woodiana]|uniref:Mab-21-like HhH/H2TH-like domain-containing protein n=1 Tax=Sinanodonta woodiana TaxID=1069815 RepID=A0ABD3V6M4_SINWO